MITIYQQGGLFNMDNIKYLINYLGCGISRTQHVMLAKRTNLYIATDNEISYNKFKTKYKNRIKNK